MAAVRFADCLRRHTTHLHPQRARKSYKSLINVLNPGSLHCSWEESSASSSALSTSETWGRPSLKENSSSGFSWNSALYSSLAKYWRVSGDSSSRWLESTVPDQRRSEGEHPSQQCSWKWERTREVSEVTLTIRVNSSIRTLRTRQTDRQTVSYKTLKSIYVQQTTDYIQCLFVIVQNYERLSSGGHEGFEILRLTYKKNLGEKTQTMIFVYTNQ